VARNQVEVGVRNGSWTDYNSGTIAMSAVQASAAATSGNPNLYAGRPLGQRRGTIGREFGLLIQFWRCVTKPPFRSDHPERKGRLLRLNH
jgi:hypothetical protein